MPILPKLRDALADPFSMVLDQQRVVDGERRAILAEMTRDNSQHDEIVDSWPLEILLAQDNPLAINPLGSEDAVKKVTVEDLRRHLRRIVNPDGMTITVFAEGKPLGKRVAVRELEKLFKDFPPSDGVAKPFPWDKLDQLNPDLCTETVYQKDTGIRTGQVSALLFWPIRRELYGRSYFALRNFSTLLSRDLHTVARHVGLGYVEGVKIIETSGELAILATRVDFRKQDFDSEEFAARFPDLTGTPYNAHSL